MSTVSGRGYTVNTRCIRNEQRCSNVYTAGDSLLCYGRGMDVQAVRIEDAPEGVMRMIARARYMRVRGGERGSGLSSSIEIATETGSDDPLQVSVGV